MWLNHPNIVQATDAGEADGMHYLVMELVDGIDLSKLVSRRGPLPVPDACECIRQAALGLQHAHENDRVHRDIRPSNLMLALAHAAFAPALPLAGEKVGVIGLAEPAGSKTVVAPPHPSMAFGS